MEYAIICNNKGAQLFEAGYHHDAMNMFQTAMNTMRSVAQDKAYLESTHGASRAVSDERKSRGALQENNNASSSTSNQSNNVGNSISGERDTACILYDKPIRVNIEDLDPSNMYCEQELMAVHTSAMLFNMGLLYHMKRTSHALQNAMHLYAMSYSTLSDIKEIQTSNDMYCRLVMAMLNNIAQIHEELGSFDTMQNFLEMLSNFHSSSRSFFSCELYEEMSSLLLCAELTSVSVAPAA